MHVDQVCNPSLGHLVLVFSNQFLRIDCIVGNLCCEHMNSWRQCHQHQTLKLVFLDGRHLIELSLGRIRRQSFEASVDDGQNIKSTPLQRGALRK